jgi:hypothetical protein
VRVTDEDGNPVPGSVTGFLLPETGASGTFANGIKALSIVTDSLGRAVASFTPNTITGAYQITVTAAFEGKSATGVISQTNTSGSNRVAPAGSGSGLSSTAIGLIAATAGAVAIGLVLSQKGESIDPGTQNPPTDTTGTGSVRITLGGTPPVVGAPGGWQSSVKASSPMPKWRP